MLGWQDSHCKKFSNQRARLNKPYGMGDWIFDVCAEGDAGPHTRAVQRPVQTFLIARDGQEGLLDRLADHKMITYYGFTKLTSSRKLGEVEEGL